MSPKPEITPATSPSTGRTAPLTVLPAPKKPSSWWIWAILVVITGGSWAAYQTLAKPAAQNTAAQIAAIRTAKVTTGSIKRVLRLTGSTTAKNFRSVAAPNMLGPD